MTSIAITATPPTTPELDLSTIFIEDFSDLALIPDTSSIDEDLEHVLKILEEEPVEASKKRLSFDEDFTLSDSEEEDVVCVSCRCSKRPRFNDFFIQNGLVFEDSAILHFNLTQAVSSIKICIPDVCCRNFTTKYSNAILENNEDSTCVIILPTIKGIPEEMLWLQIPCIKINTILTEIHQFYYSRIPDEILHNLDDTKKKPIMLNLILKGELDKFELIN